MDDIFFTVDEFAKQLKLSKQLIYRMIRDKKLHAVALGDGPKPRWRIPKTELQRLHSMAYLDELAEETQNLGLYDV